MSRRWRAVIKVGASSQATSDERWMRLSSVEKAGLAMELGTHQHFEPLERHQAAQA